MKTTNLLFLLVTLGGLGEEHLVDAGEHTTRGDGHVGEELVQLLIVADRELDVVAGTGRIQQPARERETGSPLALGGLR